MRTLRMGVVALVLAAGLCWSTHAVEVFTKSSPPTVLQWREFMAQYYFANCCNYTHDHKSICWECLFDTWVQVSCPYVTSQPARTEDTNSALHTESPKGSLIDNMSFNHLHFAWDYQVKSQSGGDCSSCGGGSSPTAELPRFELMRIHRYREESSLGSFGPGVFCPYDIKLKLYTLGDGSTLIDLMDPTLMASVHRFVDGPYTHPFNPTDPKDGTYVSYMTNSHQGILLLDVNGAPATDQSVATQAILTAWGGKKFYFQVIMVDGQRVGRLTRVEDRNGYGISLTYKFNPGDDLGGSEPKLWQIDTVTDPYGKQGTFTYSVSTVGGRWVVTQVAMPNSTSVAYSYAVDGYLSGVSYPDGAASTFVRAFDSVSNCTALTYSDAGAEGIHRNKTVYLTTNFAYTTYLPDDVVPQAGMLVRLLVNGAGELAYANFPLEADGAWETWVFEGNGVLKHLNAGSETLYMYDWTLTRPDGQPWSFNSVTATGEWPGETLYFTSWDADWYKGIPYQRRTVEGLVINYTYNSAGNVASRTYADTTSETYLYNDFQQITQFKDRSNRVTQQGYDSRGNMISRTTGLLWQGGAVVTTPETATWAWSYYPAGNANQFLLQSATDANGNVTNYAYDSNHFLTTVTEAQDNAGDPQAVSTYAFDTAGRLASSTDPVGRSAYFTYDSRSRVTTVLYPDSSTEVFTYGTTSNANLLTSKTDRNGNVTQFEYDSAGRRNLTRMAAGTAVEAVETCSYWPGSNLKAECVDRGNRTSYVYDYRNHLASTTVRPNTATALTSASEYVYNRLNKTTDPYGRRTHYVYDANIRVKRVVREMVPNGAGTIPTSQTQRDNYLNNLARVSTPNAAYVIEDTEFDAAGNVTARVDGNGNRSTFVYDSQTRLVEQNEAVGTPIAAKTQFQYDLQGNRTLVIKPREFSEASAFRTAYTYTGRNLLKSKTEASGKPEAATEFYSYYLDRRPKETTDARGNVWTKVWKQCCARLGVEADPSIADYLGGPTPIRPVSLTEYNYSGDATHVSRARNVDPLPTCCLDDVPDADTINEATIKYDARHRPIAQTVWLTPLGTVDENAPPIYGDAGSPPGKTGLTTRWVYDENLTDGSGLDVTYAAHLTGLNLGTDSVGSAVEVTNPNGEKTVVISDGVGRAVKRIDGNGNATKSTYDAMVSGISGAPGALLETVVTDALGHAVKSETDGGGRTLATIDALAKVSTFAYDNNSNRVSWRDPNNVGENCVYDARDRETQCTDTLTPTPSVTSRTYDANNNVVTMTDALSHTTTCVYDARDRKTSCTDRIGGVTQYQYDGNSNLTQLTDAQNGATVYTYDPRNLRATETFPDTHSCTYAFDGANRLISRLDQAGATTAYVYDLANRLTNRNYPDSLNDTFAYDNASRLTQAVSGRYSNTVTRGYDAGGRMTSEAINVGSKTFTTASAYDAANRRTSITYPDGKVVLQAFTVRNQLASVDYNGTNVATLAYDDGMRQTTKTFVNGKVETRTYRSDNRIATIQTPGVTDLAYTYDANKNPLTKNNALNTVDNQTYTYDFEDRLTNFTRQSGFNQNWTLSLVGDWTNFNNNGSAETRTHNAVHELTAINATPLAYDLKGNLTTNSNAQVYTWDFENLMQTAQVGANTATYKYDALRRRIQKIYAGTTTTFAYDGWRCIAEYTGTAATNNPARAYVFGTYLDEPLMMVTTPKSTATKRYYHTDHLYSVYALTDAAGTVVERYRYEAYGKATVMTAAFAPKANPNYSQYANPWTYTGQRLDAETSLHYYKNRYYSAGLGRFVGRDPVGYEAGSMGLYQYVGGAPSLRTDPSGLIDWNVDAKTCVIEMVFTLKLKKKSAASWTDPRWETFKREVKKSIEKSWNSNTYRAFPERDSYTETYDALGKYRFDGGLGGAGWYCKPCPCAATGWKLTLLVDVVEDSWDNWSDNTVTVAPNPQNPNGTWPFIQSSTGGSYSNWDEADPYPRTDASAPGQVPASHEYGHALGLSHPGADYYGTNHERSYTYTGKDKAGNDVSRSDLMGRGTGLRPFYFKKWLDHLDDLYPDCAEHWIR